MRFPGILLCFLVMVALLLLLLFFFYYLGSVNWAFWECFDCF
jgi:hypothetical protein